MTNRFQAVFAGSALSNGIIEKNAQKDRLLSINSSILTPELYERWFLRPIVSAQAAELLDATIKRLHKVQNHLLSIHSPEENDGTTRPASRKKQRLMYDIDALLIDALPSKKLQEVISTVLTEIGKRLMSLPEKYYTKQAGASSKDLIPRDHELTKKYLHDMTTRLCFAGSVLVKAYAVASSELVLCFTSYHFLDLNDCAAQLGKQLQPGLNPATQLPLSVKHAFFPFLRDFLAPLSETQRYFRARDGNETSQYPPHDIIDGERTENGMLSEDFWSNVALEALCQCRLKNAYAIITSENSRAKILGLLDLRDFCQDVRTKNQIADRLMDDIGVNLLQPGTSSVKILDTYMIIIKTLTSKLPDGSHIDPSNVLLSQSSFVIRGFLREREDAPRIVISSLLEPQADESASDQPVALASHESFSGQISLEMYLHGGADSISKTFEGADLFDKDWLPTAESVETYVQSHSKDSVLLTSPSALRHVITFAPLETFVEQLERILAERLLKSDQLDFNVEMSLLKILQADFGDSLIQSCENMLHDMMESARWNEKIKWSKDLALPYLRDNGFQAKILSHSSWQTLQWEKGVRLANVMEKGLRNYEQVFDSIQEDRRLEWIKELGRLTVEIDLEDRTITEEVTPLQAAVLYQFTDLQSISVSPVSLTVEQIQQALETDETVIRAALQFWVAKVVLQPASADHDTFSVVERLSSAENGAVANAAAAAAAVQEPETSAMPSQADLLAQHADMYSAYIVGMLTNMGAMEVQRIHSMLTMLAPGGFAFEVDDLLEFLNDMSSEGKIERAGALWRIVQL